MMDKEMKKRVLAAIRRTYEVVAYDLEGMCAELGETMTLADAIEGAIDADRVRDYGRDDEAAEALYETGLNWEQMKALGTEALGDYFA